MVDSSKLLEWDNKFKVFLKEWFSGLIEGMEKINDETWPKVLEMTGRACARVHSGELFRKTWESTKNVDKFIIEINEAMGEEIYKKLDNSTLSASYSKCKCPLVRYNLIDSPLLCECSPNWLMENFETILGKPVSVKTEKTILRGAKNCYFIISM